LLPRNQIFDDDAGYVIDFDLMREKGGLYIARYNHSAFGAYRHKDAHAGNKMQKEHDFWSLMQMSKEYFANHDGIDNVTDILVILIYMLPAPHRIVIISLIVSPFGDDRTCNVLSSKATGGVHVMQSFGYDNVGGCLF
jgi:hypothetical protein